MSAAHGGGGPQLKLPYIIAGVVMVFILSYIGHWQMMHHTGGHFSFWGVLYATILFFFLHHADPEPHNTLILIAELLALLMFLYGIFHFLLQGLQHRLLIRKIRNQYHGHTVLIGEGKIASRMAASLDEEHRKAIYLYTGADKGHYHFHALLRLEPSEGADPLEDAAVHQAKHLIITCSGDAEAIQWLKKIEKYLHEHSSSAHHRLHILLHLNEQPNTDLIKDYYTVSGSPGHIDLEVFNEHQLAAQKMYDQYAPHLFLPLETEGDHRIALLGYNAAAEQFLLENIILSHYPGLQPLVVYLLDEHADEAFHSFQYNYPYYKEFIELIPVRQNNRHFYANFTWSKETIERISKVSAVYVFGEDDAALINRAASFRQFLYSQVQVMREVPVIVCLPQNSDVMETVSQGTASGDSLVRLMESKMQIFSFRQLSQTCTGNLLIDHRDKMNQLALIINFYYALLYEGAGLINMPGKQTAFEEAATHMLELAGTPGGTTHSGIEHQVLTFLSGPLGTPVAELQGVLGMEQLFARLSLRKRDSNRYAARHVVVKLYFLQKLQNDLSPARIREWYPMLAPIEHKRWCAEKMVCNFRYAPFPEDKTRKHFLKEVLKIHDQLIAYDQLTEHEKQKDLNLFLLLPLLAGMLNATPVHPEKSAHS